MPLLIKCSSPFAAPRHPHLRGPPHVGARRRVVHHHRFVPALPQLQPCLSVGSWPPPRMGFPTTWIITGVLQLGNVLSYRHTLVHQVLPSHLSTGCLLISAA